MPTEPITDQQWMQQALEQAQLAEAEGEVPVGAIVVLDQQIIGKGYNRPIGSCDPTAHAEIQALRAAAAAVSNYRLVQATLYVTLEPCSMCAGAIVHSRIQRLVFGANEPKAGVAGSQQNFFESPWLNHRVEVTQGVLASECSQRLKDFFASRRAAQKAQAKAD